MLQTTFGPTILARVRTKRPAIGAKLTPLIWLRCPFQRAAERDQNQEPGSRTKAQELEGRGGFAQAEICNRF